MVGKDFGARVWYEVNGGQYLMRNQHTVITVVTPAGEKPALAVPAKHWPRDTTEVTLAMDPVHCGEGTADGGEGTANQ